MIFRRYCLPSPTVTDSILVKRGDKSLPLDVEVEPARLVAGLNQAQQAMTAAKDATDPMSPSVQGAAKAYARAIFGPEQAEKLFAFYGGDGGSVIRLCTMYMQRRLRRKIVRAQRRMK